VCLDGLEQPSQQLHALSAVRRVPCREEVEELDPAPLGIVLAVLRGRLLA
jgi:hypothetical protein